MKNNRAEHFRRNALEQIKRTEELVHQLDGAPSTIAILGVCLAAESAVDLLAEWKNAVVQYNGGTNDLD